MPKSKTKIVGAVQERLNGPGVITHEGGDPILIADIEGGMPQDERTLVFEGEEVVVDGDDEFHPSDPSDRSEEIGENVLIRALGQANYTFVDRSKKEDEDG